MNQIIYQNIDKVKAAMKMHQVKNAYAFGSVCTSRFTEVSDIDFLVSFKEMAPEDYADNYFALLYKLQEIFNRDIDLVTDKSLKNLYFIKIVNQTKTAVYE